MADTLLALTVPLKVQRRKRKRESFTSTSTQAGPDVFVRTIPASGIPPTSRVGSSRVGASATRAARTVATSLKSHSAKETSEKMRRLRTEVKAASARLRHDPSSSKLRQQVESAKKALRDFEVAESEVGDTEETSFRERVQKVIGGGAPPLLQQRSSAKHKDVNLLDGAGTSMPEKSRRCGEHKNLPSKFGAPEGSGVLSKRVRVANGRRPSSSWEKQAPKHRREYEDDEELSDFIVADEGDNCEWKAALRQTTGYDPRRYRDEADIPVAGFLHQQREERYSTRVADDEDAREEARQGTKRLG